MPLLWRTLFCSLSRRNYSIVAPRWMGGRIKRGRSHLKGKPPGLAKSLAEKVAEHNPVDPDIAKPVDIGAELVKKRTSWREMMTMNKAKRANSELEQAARLNKLAIPLDQVQSEYLTEMCPSHTKVIAEHYGIYQDLFGGAFFYPVLHLNVDYDLGDGEHVMPVYRGNKITPTEASHEPSVEYNAEDNTLWTLMMTNPDTHLTDNSAEYLHWMIGNIPGSGVEKGEVLCNYLQPFPPRGTGLHRHIFLLFKQSQRLDYSDVRRPDNCTSLVERTFSTYEFYKQRSEQLTPMGLCFFQSQHDDSVKDVYHKILDMREPAFEYKHPLPYHPPQRMYPHKEPFDRYYDRYRDSKDIAEEVLKLKLASEKPFQEPEPASPYPETIHRPRGYMPSWLKQKKELIARRIEQFKDL